MRTGGRARLGLVALVVALGCASLLPAAGAAAPAPAEPPGASTPVAMPEVDGTVAALARHGSVLYLGGLFTSVGGEPRQNLAAIDLSDGSVTEWDPQVPQSSIFFPVRSLAVDAGGSTVFLGGSFDVVGGVARHNLAAVSTTGTGATTAWNPVVAPAGPESDVSTLALDDSTSTLYFGGAVESVNGEPRSGVAAVSATGTGELTGWNPGFRNDDIDADVTGLALDPTAPTIYVGGLFDTVGGQPRDNLATVSTTGVGTPTAWNPGADGLVRSFALDPANGLVYVAGSFALIGGATHFGFGALTTSGVGAAADWPIGSTHPCSTGSALGVNPERSRVYVGCERAPFSTEVGLQAVPTRPGYPTNESYPVGLTEAVLVAPDGTLFVGGEDGLHAFAPPAPVSLPTVSVGNASVAEGDVGSRLLRTTVSLSKAVGYPVSVRYDATGGPATSKDYFAKSGWVTIPAGATSAPVSIWVRGDGSVEPDEFFRIKLSHPQAAGIGRASGVATIVNDDDVAGRRVAVGDAAVAEGESGTRLARFAVSLSRAHTVPVSVTFATVSRVAQAGSDFSRRTQRVTIPAGATSTTVTVLVNGDATAEPNESFTVKISAPAGAVLGRSAGTGKILDDDRLTG